MNHNRVPQMTVVFNVVVCSRAVTFMLQGGPGPAGRAGVDGRRGTSGPKVCGLYFIFSVC